VILFGTARGIMKSGSGPTAGASRDDAGSGSLASISVVQAPCSSSATFRNQG